MNIRYRGASEDTNNLRFAEIQYVSRREQDDVDRFLCLMNTETRNYYSEDEVVTIEVEDKDDYEYVKEIYNAYNHFDYVAYVIDHGLQRAVNKWYVNKLTDYGLYEECDQDVDLYIILVNEGYKEEEVKNFMDEVSGAPDAYNNALIQFYEMLS